LPVPLAYFICGLVGFLVGAAELFSRYRDQPMAILTCISGWIYVSLNGAASLVVLYLANSYKWNFGVKSASTALLSHVLIASFGAMALLRTSLFNLKLDNQMISIGPSAILSSLLGIADRGVDRARAVKRSEYASTIMGSVLFSESYVALPTFCLALLQNPNTAEQEDLRQAVKALHDNGQMTDSQKSMNLGLLLMNIVGPKGLRAAVTALGSDIKSIEVSVPRQSRRRRSPVVAEESDRAPGDPQGQTDNAK
jgi:hypothetical protein